MPENAVQSHTANVSPAAWYSYAIIRVVPRVERGECLNVGIVLFARERNHLDARIEVDDDRLRTLAPDVDLDMIDRHLRVYEAICAGSAEAGPIGELPPSERFHWLTSPRSTVIQTSPVHAGVTSDPAATIEELMDAFVRPPRA